MYNLFKVITLFILLSYISCKSIGHVKNNQYYLSKIDTTKEVGLIDSVYFNLPIEYFIALTKNTSSRRFLFDKNQLHDFTCKNSEANLYQKYMLTNINSIFYSTLEVADSLFYIEYYKRYPLKSMSIRCRPFKVGNKCYVTELFKDETKNNKYHVFYIKSKYLNQENSFAYRQNQIADSIKYVIVAIPVK